MRNQPGAVWRSGWLDIFLSCCFHDVFRAWKQSSGCVASGLTRRNQEQTYEAIEEVQNWRLCKIDPLVVLFPRCNTPCQWFCSRCCGLGAQLLKLSQLINEKQRQRVPATPSARAATQKSDWQRTARHDLGSIFKRKLRNASTTPPRLPLPRSANNVWLRIRKLWLYPDERTAAIEPGNCLSCETMELGSSTIPEAIMHRDGSLLVR